MSSNRVDGTLNQLSSELTLRIGGTTRSCAGLWMCGRFHPHCVTSVAFSSALTAPRAKVPPLSLVITKRWSAPLLAFQYLPQQWMVVEEVKEEGVGEGSEGEQPEGGGKQRTATSPLRTQTLRAQS